MLLLQDAVQGKNKETHTAYFPEVPRSTALSQQRNVAVVAEHTPFSFEVSLSTSPDLPDLPAPSFN